MLRRTSANYDANAEPAARRSVSSSKSNPEEIEFSPLTSRERDLTSRDRARGSRKQLLGCIEYTSERAEPRPPHAGKDTQMTLSAKPTKRSDPSLRPLNSHSTFMSDFYSIHTGGAGLKTCSHGYLTVRFSCTMLDGMHSGVKPHTCKSAMLPTVNPRHRSGVARGRAPSRWPLVRTARPSRCPRPTCNTSKRGCPPRRHTRRHLAPSSMGPGRTSTQKRVTFGGELA